MQLSVELTMYPFNPEYLTPIKSVIEKINSFDGIQTQTFPTATIMMGDYDRVMDCLKELLRWSHEQHGKAVFVAKFLPNSSVLS